MDYKWKTRQQVMARSRRGGRRKTPAVILSLAAIAATFLLLTNHPAVHDTEARTEPIESAGGPPSPPAPPRIEREILTGTIQPGETISSLLGQYFSSQELHHMSRESRNVFPLSGICAGQPYKLCLKEGAFERFEYDINRDHQLVIRREESGVDISRVPIEYTVETETVRGSISSSLFEAVGEIGENPELAIALADIFAYDIDFIRDIRHGDTFQAVVEKRFREGKPAGYGRILAAEFTNQGKNYQAFRFRDGDRPAAYYNAKGESLRTAFLRAPLSFSRISSGYTMRRFHPITRTWKSHPAIDYAAPTGTPIKTIGDGTIVAIGQTRGNGKYIKIRHPNGYETMYLHMSRFAKGMQKGRRVSQGDVIGNVGSTGLATGPHLCFRMTKNGAPINPNSVRTAAAAPVSKERMADFRAALAPLVARLEGGDTQQAQAGPPADDITLR